MVFNSYIIYNNTKIHLLISDKDKFLIIAQSYLLNLIVVTFSALSHLLKKLPFFESVVSSELLT